MRRFVSLLFALVVPVLLSACSNADAKPIGTRTVCGTVDTLIVRNVAPLGNPIVILKFTDGRSERLNRQPEITVSRGKMYSFKVEIRKDFNGDLVLIETGATNLCGYDRDTTAVVDSVQIFTLENQSGFEVVYTDRRGCRVEVDGAEVSVVADSVPSLVRQTASIGRGNREVSYGFRNGGKIYDQTRESDLINRQCGKMIRAIPDPEIRRLAMLTLDR